MKPFVLSASQFFLRAVVMAGIIAALLAHTSLHAATYYWDNLIGAGFGTAGGTWTAPTLNQWNTSNTGADSGLQASYTTSIATTDALNFGTASAGLGAGTITVSGTVEATSLTFGSASGAITLSGGSINLGPTTSPTITVNNTLATINSSLTGTFTRLTKTGTGELVLSGSSTIGANVRLAAGKVTLSGSLSNTNAGANSFQVGFGASAVTMDVTGSLSTNMANARAIVVGGGSGWNGTLNLSGTGSVIASGAGGGLMIGEDTGGTGLYNQTGGTTSLNSLWMVGNTSTLTVSGGTFTNPGNTFFAAAVSVPTTATINVNGTGSITLGALSFGVSGRNYTSATLNVGNGSPGGTFQVNTMAFAGGTGTSTINFDGGTFVANNTTSVPTQVGTVVKSGGANINVVSGRTLTIGTVLTDGGGGGGLTKGDTGTLILSGANTYSGPTTITGGLLTLSNSLALQNSTLDTTNSIASSSTTTGLKTTVTTLTLGGLSGDKDLASLFDALNGYTNVTTLTLNPGTGVSNSYSGAITNGSGATTLTKTGAGTQVLTGDNTYTGTTTISAGVLQADQADVAGVSGALGNGGDIIFGGGALQFTANSAGNDYSTRIKSSGSAMIFDTNGQDVTFGTALATSNTGGLTKNGTGMLNLKMGTSYSGTTTINGGTLRFTNVADLASVSTAAFQINNGSTLEFQSSIGGNNRTQLNNKTFTFDSNGGGTINFNNGNHLFQAPANTHNFITTGGAKNTISSTNGGFMNMQGGGNPVFTVADGTDDWDLELSATYINGLITKNGSGTMAITGTHSGDFAITINAGTLEVAGSARLNSGSFTAAIAVDGVFKHSSNQTQTLSGNITGTGALWKSAGAALTLSGNNSYSGATTVDAVLEAGSTTALSANSAFTVNSGGNLILNGNSNTIGSLAGAGTVKNQNVGSGSAATLTTGGDNNSTIFSGAIIDGPSGAGAMSLVKTGSGTMALSGSNTYSGTTTVSSGALQVGSGGSGTTGTGDVTVQTGSTILGSGVVRGSSFSLITGATLRPGDSTADSSHGTLTFTPASASASGSTSSLQGSIILGITTATTVDASYGGNVLGSAGYNAWVDAVSGVGSHDRLVFSNPTSGSGYGVDFLTTTGSLQVVGSSFTAVQGMAFNLLDWGNLVTSNFSGFTYNSGYLTGNGDEGADLDLPDLSGTGLFWDFSRFTTSGVIVIVPEPSRVVLLMLGLSGLFIRRRR